MSPSSQLPFFEDIPLTQANTVFIESFPFASKKTKRPRPKDVLVLEKSPKQDVNSLDLCLYRNPCDPSYRGTPEPPSHRWDKVKIVTLKSPRDIVYADISKNGYNDVILVDEFASGNKINLHGGRVTWLENTGSTTGTWVRREIGRYPGTRFIKVGHFTNTFSLQVMAVSVMVPVSDSGKGHSPIVVYTQPSNIVSGQPWLSSMAFPDTFRLISAIHVIPHTGGHEGGLDKVLLASTEGVTLLWWEMSRWHVRGIGPTMVRTPRVTSGCGLVSIGNIGESPLYIVSSEPFTGHRLIVYSRSHAATNMDMHNVQWSKHVVDDFGPEMSIIQARCADFDGDGVDEIVALIRSKEAASRNSVEGLYYYRPVESLIRGEFEKWKISDGPMASFVAEDFQLRDKIDIITASSVADDSLDLTLEGGLVFYSNALSTPLIYASILPDTTDSLHSAIRPSLLLTVSDPSSLTDVAYELPLFQTINMSFSLVLLAPKQAYKPSKTHRDSGPSSIKVLLGSIEWITPLGNKVARKQALPYHSKEQTRSVAVKAKTVVAGEKGAIFLNIASSNWGNGLQVQNLISQPYPTRVQEFLFQWIEAAPEEEFASMKVFTLDGFRMQLIGQTTDIAHIHLTAFYDPSSHDAQVRRPTLIPGPSPAPTQRAIGPPPTCQVRTCLVNGGQSGGIYCADDPGNNTPDHRSRPPKRTRAARPSAWVVPSLTEVVPTWYIGEDGEPLIEGGRVQYPPVYGWLSDVSRLLDKQQMALEKEKDRRRKAGVDAGTAVVALKSWDVWMDVDFPPFVVDIQEAASSAFVLTTKGVLLSVKTFDLPPFVSVWGYIRYG
ncbi:hypothetical protein BU17DRAFT_101373 [Hysterangium stoloniferum]|nr:hypothetical protein BU17DRAFT_101373 [Hysterangium stoloniferum]